MSRRAAGLSACLALGVACVTLAVVFSSEPWNLLLASTETNDLSFPTAHGTLRDEWTAPEHAYADDGRYAQAFAYDYSGDNEDDDEQSFEAFGLDVPDSVIIEGIELEIKAYSDDDGEDCDLDAKLFWHMDGGWTSFATGYKTWWNIENDVGVKTLGGPTDTWGRDAWVADDFADASFAVGLRAAASSGCGYDDHVFVDYLGVKVYYDAPPIDDLSPRTNNPALIRQACNKVDFNFVIDTSSSLDGYGSAIVSSMSTFVETFEDSGGDGLYSASTFSGESGQSLTSGYVSQAQLQSALTNLPSPGGRTPAADGITVGIGNSANDRVDAPNVMLVITDGSPNVPPPASQYDPDDSDTWLMGANAAIDAANRARSAGFVVRAAFEGQVNDALPWSEQGKQDWIAAVMNRIDGSPAGYLPGGYGTLAEELIAAVGCRTIRVRKEVGDTEAPTETFHGTISNTEGAGSSTTWSLETPDNVYVDFTVPLNLSHAVAEATPLEAGWTLEGYSVQAGLSACPAAGYSNYDATVSEGVEDTTVCVKNSYDTCMVSETLAEGPAEPCLETFTYQVCQRGQVGLSHWTLELPSCTPELSSAIGDVEYQLGDTWSTAAPCLESASQDHICYSLGQDESCNVVEGLTWHIPEPLAIEIKDGVCVLFSVTFDQLLQTQPLGWRAQAGSCPCAGAGEVVTGPSCSPCCTAPQAAFSATPAAGCAPLIVRFSDQSVDATSWHWDFGDGKSSTEQHPSHSYANAGTYTVALSVSNVCGEDLESKEGLISVSDPQVNISPAYGEIDCNNHAVQLNASVSKGKHPFSYQWHRDGDPLSGATSSTFDATQPGSYSVSVTDANGCTDTGNLATITAIYDPEVTVSPTSAELNCNRQTIALTATVSGGEPPYAYQWHRDGNPLSAATSSTFDATQPGSYSVSVTDQKGCAGSSNIAIVIENVDPPPVVVEDIMICDHELPARMSSETNAISPLYRWTVLPTDCPDPGPVSAFDTSSPGQYCVEITEDETGCAGSDCGTLTIHQGPEISEHPVDVEICEGDPATFRVEASGDDLTYEWQVDNSTGWVDLPAAISSSYVITGVAERDDGSWYRVIVTAGPCGSLPSRPAALRVRLRPTAFAPDVILCDGYSAAELRLAIAAAGGGCSLGTQSITENPDGTYTLSCSDQCGSDESIGNIDTGPNPRVSITGLEVPLLPATLTADTSRSDCPVTSHQWYTGTSVTSGTLIAGATDSVLQVSAEGDYAVQVYCDNGCVAQATGSVVVIPAAGHPLEVTKEASTASAPVGSSVTYTYNITNLGDETLSEIAAYDDKLGVVTLSQTRLLPGEKVVGTTVCTIESHHYPGPLVNEVTVTAYTSATGTITKTASASIEIGLPPIPDTLTIFLPFIEKQAVLPVESPNSPYLPLLLKKSVR